MQQANTARKQLVDSFFSRFRNPLVLMAIVLAQVLALAIQVQRPSGLGAGHEEGHHVTLLRHWLLAVVTPVERLSHGTGLDFRHTWSNYLDLRHTREHDQQLQQEIARLRTEQAQFAEDAREGRRLQALLHFQQSYIATTVAAQVIGTSGSDRARILTLDKGAADGLKIDQPVMTPDGVVGKLRDVSAHTCELQLLSDPNSGAGVVLVDVRIRGILRGTADGRVEINNLTADSRIKPGETIITSGGDGVFPRGLPVGVIQSVAPDPHHQPYTAIVVKPAADLARLEEVLVITGMQNSLPPAAAADAAQADDTADAAASAAAAKRAADMMAERLPSMHDDDAAGGAAPTTDASGAPVVVIPRPKPAAHPDRYSPGNTPSADALQPGAPAPSSDSDSKPGDR
jgi:rod shape-determining protein MreC